MTADKPASGRLVELAVENMTAAQLAAYKRLVTGPRGRLPTPYKLWLHSPPLAEALEGLGTYLLQRSSLTKREVEIAILVVALHFDAEYVFRAHWREAEAAGLPRDAIRAIRAGTTPPLADPRERAVYVVAAALCGGGSSVSQQIFDDTAAQLGQHGIADLLALLGYYTSVAFMTKLCAVPLPPEPGA
jgi:4-carboxymuconolactone decarboxylase